jgi:uncharacterized protein (TIGR02996 family)
MEQEQGRGLLQAIAEEPDDDNLRMIYADWLTERGDPRGEFIHAQVRWQQAYRVSDVAGMVQHNGRQWTLRRQHETTWLAPLLALGLYNVEFRRGLVESGTITAKDFLKNCHRLFELAPLLRELMFDKEGPDWLPTLAEFPTLRRLESIHFMDCKTPTTTLGTFASSPYAVNLRKLYLQQARLHGPDVPGNCLQLLGLPRLTHLRFDSTGIWPRGFRQRLPPTPLGNEFVVALAQAPGLSRLRALGLRAIGITDPAVVALAGSPHLACLEALHLGNNPIADGAAQALAASPSMASVTDLDLWFTQVGNAGLAAVIRSPHLTSLRTLSVGSRITNPGAVAIANAPESSRLRHLELGCNYQLGVGGAEALAASDHLGSLLSLGLRDTKVGRRGALALIASTKLPELRTLSVGTEGSRGDPVVYEAMEKRFGLKAF